NEVVPGILLFRVEAALLYFNTEHVSAAILEKVFSGAMRPKFVVCDLSTSPMVDLAGARMLAGLQEKLAAEGITFRLAEAHATVRDILRAEGLEERVGPIDRRISINDVVGQIQTATDPK
ncbi:MAG TPA: sodium-independent anion transporter, partial [Acidobacteriota bacterium]|nr:sodium-independent anion transporter [Acidobacteriota bacterium]